jgi:hypothetical protein
VAGDEVSIAVRFGHRLELLVDPGATGWERVLEEGRQHGAVAAVEGRQPGTELALGRQGHLRSRGQGQGSRECQQQSSLGLQSMG